MSNIKLFESKQIRSIWSEDDQKWYFSIIDVVAALTDSQNPRDYWYRIKQREKISGVELSTICRQFQLKASDGKSHEKENYMLEVLKLLFVMFTRNPFFLIPSVIGILYFIGVETGVITCEMRQAIAVNRPHCN